MYQLLAVNFSPYDKLVSWPMYMCAYVLCEFHMVTVYLRPLTLMRSIAKQSGQRLAQVCCTITAYEAYATTSK